MKLEVKDRRDYLNNKLREFTRMEYHAPELKPPKAVLRAKKIMRQWDKHEDHNRYVYSKRITKRADEIRKLIAFGSYESALKLIEKSIKEFSK